MRDLGLQEAVRARRHAERADGRHGLLHEPRGRRAGAPAHLGHASRGASPTTRWRARACTSTCRRPTSSRSSSAPRPSAARTCASTPSSSPSSRTHDGVTATVRDRLSGATYEIRAKYLLAGDGGRSVIAEQLGLPFGGQANVAGSMNIVFKADLSALVAHRPSVLYWIMSPGARMGGIGMGLVRMVRPWDEWLIVWGYDIDGPAPEVDDARATEIAHKLIGTDEIDVEIVSTSLWTNNKLWAERYSAGPRVLHGRRRPPPPAVERARLEHLGRRRLQPRLEARARAARPRRPVAASHLRRRARAGRRADRQAREQEHRGVRPDLRGARPARRDRGPGADGAQHGGPHAGHPGRRRSSARSCAPRSS